jgi:hypothetical protein
MSALPHFSDVNLLCDGKRVIGVCRVLQGLMEYPPASRLEPKGQYPRIGLCPNAERMRFASVKC